MSNLVDSGARTTFETGAMREIVEEKGRCDLLPLDIVSNLLAEDPILASISDYIASGQQQHLYSAMIMFINEDMKCDMYTAMLELAKHYEDGAKKYAERNWERGLPLHSFIDSAVRHYLKFQRGDNDEHHDRAFLWNLFGVLWTQTHKKEVSLFDLPFTIDQASTALKSK